MNIHLSVEAIVKQLSGFEVQEMIRLCEKRNAEIQASIALLPEEIETLKCDPKQKIPVIRELKLRSNCSLRDAAREVNKYLA